MVLPWQWFCQGAFGQNFQVFERNGIFLAQIAFTSDFLAQNRNQRPKIGLCANLSQIGQKIKDLKFQP